MKIRTLALAISLLVPVSCYLMLANAQTNPQAAPQQVAQQLSGIKAQPPSDQAAKASAPQAMAVSQMSRFKSTITTVFWVGEAATGENGHIPNYASYWDANWVKHFGGVDSPVSRRGFLPAKFTPKENPFYVALPFAETDRNGRLKASAKKIPGYGQGKGPLTKNRWVEIRYKGKSCYGQWQDVGPFGENDFDWVFGNATKPKNRSGEKAGLDVSPAIAKYIGLTENDRTEWRFVDEKDVADGPWRQIVTR